jgi:hypothetical protein
MARGSRLNLDHRRKAPPMSSRQEWLSRHYNESVAQSSKALLKAQLTTGQHALDKDRFVQTAINYGWILQVPARLLA